MKKVIIVHGYTGHPDKNWFPWLKSELEKDGIETLVPHMPNADAPKLSEWLPHLRTIVREPDTDTYLVGHSLGCITILKYLETLDTEIGGIILVAGFAEPIHLTELNNFFASDLIDEKIKKATKNIILINSNNDEHVPLWHGEKMAKRFGAELIILDKAGHINEKSGYKELPIVLTKLRNMISSKS